MLELGSPGDVRYAITSSEGNPAPLTYGTAREAHAALEWLANEGANLAAIQVVKERFEFAPRPVPIPGSGMWHWKGSWPARVFLEAPPSEESSLGPS